MRGAILFLAITAVLVLLASTVLSPRLIERDRKQRARDSHRRRYVGFRLFLRNVRRYYR